MPEMRRNYAFDKRLAAGIWGLGRKILEFP